MISKFLYIIVILLICIILIQIMQICSSSSKFIESFEESDPLSIINNKLNIILENCYNISAQPSQKKSQTEDMVDKKNSLTIKKSKPPKSKDMKKKGVILTEDNDIKEEEDNDNDDDDEYDTVEGFMDGLSHNCSFV